MKKICLAAFALLLCGTASAQDAKVQRIDVVEFGIYTLDSGNATRDANGVLHADVTNIRLAVRTRNIPLQHNVSFGLRYKIVGAPEGAVVHIKKVTIYPKPIKPPGSAKPITRTETDFERQIGETNSTFYTFEDDFETIPGRWTFELWAEGRKFASQTFNVK